MKTIFAKLVLLFAFLSLVNLSNCKQDTEGIPEGMNVIQEDEEHNRNHPWERAEIHYKRKSEFEQDFLDWITTQPQITRVKATVPGARPQLKMYRKGLEEPQEVLFAADVPVAMVKNILGDKGLLAKTNEDL